MSTFQDLLVTLTGRIVHENDFTFPKTKEELALKIKSDYLPKIHDLWGLGDATVSIDIDSEGDIAIEGVKRSLFVTRESIVFSTRPTAIGLIATGQETSETSGVLDDLFKLRRSFKALRYDIRLFLRLRFRQALPLDALQPTYFGTIVGQLSSDLVPASVETLGWQVTYHERDFIDSFELKVEPREFELRYSREGGAHQFSSFENFVMASDLGGVAERIRPFLEPLIADPTKILGIAFRRRPES